ncbi:hypothetical protein AKO1_015162, partial [Acrasis kona]
MRILVLSYLLYFVSCSPWQVNTIVGNGNDFYNYDGISSLKAQFKYISGVSVDSANNLLYLTDFSRFVIWKYNRASNTISRFAGYERTDTASISLSRFAGYERSISDISSTQSSV